MDLLGLNMPPTILLGADEVIEQDARARKLKLSRSQLGTWTKDSFGSSAAVTTTSASRPLLPQRADHFCNAQVVRVGPFPDSCGAAKAPFSTRRLS
jgi:hypothetical protein